MTEIYAKPIPRIATVCVGDELSYAHSERLTVDKDEIETTWKLAQEQTWLEQNNISKGENGYRVM